MELLNKSLLLITKKYLRNGLWFIFIIISTACQQERASISYNGIEAEPAITLLTKATTKAQINNILNRVQNQPRYGFDWSAFWKLAKIKAVAQKFDSESKKQFYALSLLTCQRDSRDQFAQLALEDISAHAFLFDSKMQCQLPLFQSSFVNYFKFYQKEMRDQNLTALPFFAQLIKNQTLDASQEQTLRDVFDAYPPKHWQTLLSQAIFSEHTSDAILILNVYETVKGKFGLAENILAPLLTKESEIGLFIQSLGLTTSLTVLQKIPPASYAHLQKKYQTLPKILKELSKTFQDNLNESLSLNNTYQNLLALVQVLTLMESSLDYKTLFFEVDVLLKKIEISMTQKSDTFAQFLIENETSSWILWFKWRSGLTVTEQEVSDVLDSEKTNSRWLQVAHQRLKMNTLSDAFRIHAEIESFCQKMKDLNVSEQHIEIPMFSAQILSQPGCVSLKNTEPNDILEIHTDSLSMSSFSVLKTKGAHVVVDAKNVDLAIVDLSNQMSHPDLPQEPNPADADAVVLPVILGFELANDTDMHSKGFYYFVTHFTWRTAAPGLAATIQPLPGLPGGDLQINAQSISPFVFVSLGGVGQKGAPRTSGGKASESNIDMVLFRDTFEGTSEKTLQKTLLRPSIGVLLNLFENAQRNPETKRIMVYNNTEIWTKLIDDSQKQKALKICNQSLIDMNCAQKIANLAVNQVAEEIQKDQSLYGANFILERLATSDFIEPSGEPGPLNLNGEQGPSGELIVQTKGIL